MAHALAAGTRWAIFLTCALAVGQAGALAAPWFTTGGVTRSAYGFVRALGGAGVLTGWEAQLLRASVFALPVMAGLTLAAGALRAYWLAVLFCGAAAAVLLVLSLCVLVHEHGGAPVGPWLATMVSCCALALCLAYPKKRSDINVGIP